MAIEKLLVANVGESGKLYAVSGSKKFDGMYSGGKNQLPVSLMSFILANADVDPIKENEDQKFFWSMDFSNPKWQSAFMVRLNKKESNPYNAKIRTAINAMEKTANDTFPIKRNNR